MRVASAVGERLASARTFLLAQPFLIIASLALVIAAAPPVVVMPPVSGPAITDMTGRQVALTTPATRTLIFTTSLWDYLALDPNPDHISAVAGFARKAVRAGLLGEIFPAARDTPVAITKGVGTAIPGDPEDVMRRSPDAILSWDRLSESLRVVGAPVVQLKPFRRNEINLNNIEILRILAAVTSNAPAAEKIIAGHYSRLAAIAKNVKAARTIEQRMPRALHASFRHGGQLYVEAAPFNQALALQLAGAEVASTGRAGVTDIEQLLIWDPDVIILSCCYGEKVDPQFLYGDSRFRTLTAMKTRRVYKAPAGGGNMEGLAEWPLFVSWLAEIFYPDHMPRTFRADMAQTYRQVFGYELSAEQLDGLLFIEANKGSVGYERFR